MNLWQYWENFKPAFIKKCQDITRYKNPSYKLIAYSDLSSLFNFPYNISRLYTAFRADIYRICLLYNYGGIWLDSDSICMRDLSFLFKDLEKYDFVCFEEIPEAGGPFTSPNSFFASRPKGEVVSFLHQRIVEKVIKNETKKWGEMGGDLISEARKIFPDKILVYPYSRMYPIKPIREELHKFFEKRSPKEHKNNVDKNAFIYMLIDSFSKYDRFEQNFIENEESKTFIEYLIKREHKATYEDPQKIFYPYTIKPGDTLWKLFGFEWHRVLNNEKNRRILDNPEALSVGDVLWIERELF